MEDRYDYDTGGGGGEGLQQQQGAYVSREGGRDSKYLHNACAKLLYNYTHCMDDTIRPSPFPRRMRKRAVMLSLRPRPSSCSSFEEGISLPLLLRFDRRHQMRWDDKALNDEDDDGKSRMSRRAENK